MYGDLETDNECWYAIVPHFDPDWYEGEEEWEDSTKSKQNARTVRISKLSTGSPQK